MAYLKSWFFSYNFSLTSKQNWSKRMRTRTFSFYCNKEKYKYLKEEESNWKTSKRNHSRVLIWTLKDRCVSPLLQVKLKQKISHLIQMWKSKLAAPSTSKFHFYLICIYLICKVVRPWGRVEAIIGRTSVLWPPPECKGVWEMRSGCVYRKRKVLRICDRLCYQAKIISR